MNRPTFKIVKKLAKDPFAILIIIVVLAPAMLFGYGIINQQQSQRAVSPVPQETLDVSTGQGSSERSENGAQQPITEAEQPASAEEKATAAAQAPAPAAAAVGPVCDQAKKQAAESTRNSLLSQENANHERQKDRLRLISKVQSRYLDEELSRHNGVINQIEATYRSALAAANC